MSKLETLLSRMPRHFAHEPDSNNYKLLSIIAENGTDNQLVYDTMLKFWDVDQAEGVALDRLGKDEGISRGGWDDDTYRKMIKIQCMMNLSEGDIPTMNLILDAYMGEGYIGLQELWHHSSYQEPAALKANYDFDYEGDIPKSIMKRTKAAGVRAFWAAYQQIVLIHTIWNKSTSRIGINVLSNPWAFAGSTGASVEKILLDGKYNLNGEVVLNSFVNKDGAVYQTDLRLVLKVLHDFGVHDVTVTPILDGEYRLNGDILLQSDVQRMRLAVKQEAMLRHYKQVTSKLMPNPSIAVISKARTSSNPWAFAGGGIGSEQILLDGRHKLNANRFLNGYYHTDGPAYVSNTRFALHVQHHAGVHEINVLPVLDGSYGLSGEIILQNDIQLVKVIAKQQTAMRMQERAVVNPTLNQIAPTLCTTTTTSGVKTLNGAHTLNGNNTLNQTLLENSGLFRVVKNGVTVEEVAV